MIQGNPHRLLDAAPEPPWWQGVLDWFAALSPWHLVALLVICYLAFLLRRSGRLFGGRE
ncbi:MAG: hypothetical protein VW362_12235 [Candidatus Nanopelagicales bacterium]